ncbi:MAG: hypothetical protein AAF511_07870 [Pseudomonadota bacterium]
MLLRRLIDHVQAQNWTAVALDFLIVVIGVFMGIQVSNWNAARADREVERYYISRLTEEVQTSIAFNTYLEETLLRRIDEARIVRTALEDCSATDPALFGNTAYNLGKNAPATLSRGIYVEMLSTGGQGLIRSSAIRKVVADTYEYVELQDSLFELMNGDDRPARLTIATRVSMRIDAPFAYDERHPAAAFHFDYDGLCQDEVFLNAFDRLMTSNFETLSRYGRVQERLNTLEKSLREYGDAL